MGQKYYLQLQEAGTYFFKRGEYDTHKIFTASHVVVYVYINVYINQSVLWEKKDEGRHTKITWGEWDLPTRKSNVTVFAEKETKKGFHNFAKSLRKPTSFELN